MLSVSRQEITEGSLSRALVVLAVPLVAQNLVQVANQVVDIFWLGRLGEAAVAGVGLVIPVLGVIFAALFMAFVGTQTVVAQRVGAGDVTGARLAATNGHVLALGLGLAAGAAGFLLAPAIVAAFDPGAAVHPYATRYLSTFALGLPLIFLADTAEASLVGVGDSRGSFLLNGLAVGLNVLLDPLLIFGLGPFPRLGVRGAALATVIGYGAGFALAIGLFLRGRQELRLTRDALRADAGGIREIVDVGLPNTGQRVGQQSARVVLIGIVSAVSGPAGLSAYTVGARVASIAFIPAQGLGQAAQSVVAQNLGARAHDRARRATWIGAAIAVGGLGIVGALQWFVPGPLTHLFVPDASPRGAALTARYLRILAYGYPALGAVYLFAAGFNGARRTRVTMVATLLQYWAVRVPIAVVGGIFAGAGVIAVFWAVTVSNIAGAAGSGLYYRHAAADGMLVRAAARAGEAANVDPRDAMGTGTGGEND